MVSGRMGREMAEENRFGRMGHFIRDIGLKIWPMDREG